MQHPLLRQLRSILQKMESMKPYPDVTYYTSPGPMFQVENLKSEIRYGICVKCYGLVCDEWQSVWLIYTWQIFQLSVVHIA